MRHFGFKALLLLAGLNSFFGEASAARPDAAVRAESSLRRYHYRIVAYNSAGAIIYDQRWVTVAESPQAAANYASNHTAVVHQQLERYGVSRVSANYLGDEPA